MTRAHRDGGFTIVELLVTTAIVGLVVPVITMALVLGYRTTGDTIERLQDTSNRQITSALFTGDVQSATQVSVSDSYGCSLGTSTLVLGLKRQETSITGAVSTHAVVWGTDSSGSSTVLERRSCAADGSTSGVTTARIISGTPSVTCVDSGGGSSCSDAVRVDLAVTDGTDTFTMSARPRATP